MFPSKLPKFKEITVSSDIGNGTAVSKNERPACVSLKLFVHLGKNKLYECTYITDGN